MLILLIASLAMPHWGYYEYEQDSEFENAINTGIILLIIDTRNDFCVFFQRPIKSVEGMENPFFSPTVRPQNNFF